MLRYGARRYPGTGRLVSSCLSKGSNWFKHFQSSSKHTKSATQIQTNSYRLLAMTFAQLKQSPTNLYLLRRLACPNLRRVFGLADQLLRDTSAPLLLGSRVQHRGNMHATAEPRLLLCCIVRIVLVFRPLIGLDHLRQVEQSAGRHILR